jgi:hypothetical protein
MSNMQMGTRGLSSGDLTRIKRLRGSKDFLVNVLQGGKRDVNPTPVPQAHYSPEFHSPRHTGGSRIRRTGSGFTDFKAFNHADLISQGQRVAVDGTITTGKTLVGTKVCDCTRFQPKKQGLCPICLI